MSKRTDPYVLLKQIVHYVENTPNFPMYLAEAGVFTAARKYCEEIEAGLHNDVMPQIVIDQFGRSCEKCGWLVVNVHVPDRKNMFGDTDKRPPIPVAIHPVEVREGILRTCTIDISFISGDYPIYSGGGNGAWVRHDVLCGKERPDDVELALVWDACLRDYAATLAATEDELADLDEIEGTIDDL